MATIGLLGCGTWGRKILAALLELKQQVVIVEPQQAKHAAIEHEFAIRPLSHLDNASGIDGFIVATPASTHAPIVHALLQYDRPIFVEKPLTVDVKSARDLARLGNGRIFVMHVWRYSPAVLELAGVAKSGELGKVGVLRTVRKNWTSPRLDVDSVWNLVPHDLSIALAIIGHIPEPVFARAEILDGRAVGMLAVLGNDVPQVIIDTSNRYQDRRREIRLHCERGVAWLRDDADGHLLIQREADGKPGIRHFEHRPPLLVELECFVDHLHGGPPPPTPISEGVEIVEAVAALRRLAGLPD